MKETVVCRTRDVMGGAAVFCGTRVPVQTLFDYLEAGDSIDDFLVGYPSISREQVISLLQQPKNRDLESIR